jgi:hypothetical protein
MLIVFALMPLLVGRSKAALSHFLPCSACDHIREISAVKAQIDAHLFLPPSLCLNSVSTRKKEF